MGCHFSGVVAQFVADGAERRAPKLGKCRHQTPTPRRPNGDAPRRFARNYGLPIYTLTTGQGDCPAIA